MSLDKSWFGGAVEKFFGSPAFARKTDPDTSKEAAKTVDTPTLEQLVYEAIHHFPNGCTSDELMEHFPNHGLNTITPRLAPLIRKGFIEDTGERRKASSGKSQRVLKVIK